MHPTVTPSVPCARHCSKHFKHINFLNPYPSLAVLDCLYSTGLHQHSLPRLELVIQNPLPCIVLGWTWPIKRNFQLDIENGSEMAAFILHVQPDTLSKGFPVTLQQSSSCLDNSDLRFFNRWVNKLEKSKTSTMMVHTVKFKHLEMQRLRAEGWQAGWKPQTDTPVRLRATWADRLKEIKSNWPRTHSFPLLLWWRLKWFLVRRN